jgi:hypothetical protein
MAEGLSLFNFKKNKQATGHFLDLADLETMQ